MTRGRRGGHRFAGIALVASFAFSMTCGRDIPVEGLDDLCAWLPDLSNCYREFAIGIYPFEPKRSCLHVAPTPVDVDNPAPTQFGQFPIPGAPLDRCDLGDGGSIHFDPPLSIDPPSTGFDARLAFPDGTTCGSLHYVAEDNFSFTDSEVGTFAYVRSGRRAVASCPAGAPLLFDSEQARSCGDYAALVPRAEFELIPTGLNPSGEPDACFGYFGSVKFTLFLPPMEEKAAETEPQRVVVFQCSFNAPCSDGKQGQSESDIDCGGSDCRRCELDQHCNSFADCIQGAECVNSTCQPPQNTGGGGAGSSSSLASSSVAGGCP